jgi:acetyltransferase-like isoleucine patch superfamily enzyme
MASENKIHSTATIGNDCIVNNSILLEYSRLKRNVEFRDSQLGEYSYVSSGSFVVNTEIDKFTSIGPSCFIGLWEHNTDVSTHSFYLYETSGFFVKGYENYKRDHIKTFIGSDVWIGANVSLKKGIHIGHGAIIGSSAVITKDVAPYSIVVGNPGKILKYRFSEEDIKLLLNSSWWDFSREELQKMVDSRLFHDFELFKDYINKRNKF